MTKAVQQVTGLTVAEWERALAGAIVPLPFADAHWRRWGAAGQWFTPVLVGDLLVPLFTSGVDGQLGGFGYGMVCPRPGAAIPAFDELAETLCAATGLARLSTLLPPNEIDRLTGHWSGNGGRVTYLLDLTDGVDTVWARARGSVRTAVRKAGQHRLSVDHAHPADADAVAELYRMTLRRNGLPTHDAPVTFLVDGRPGVLTRVARGEDRSVHAVSAFAVAEATAFHVLQATSPAGRRNNAGHLVFFSAISELAALGVRSVDLGSATSDGQQRFKTNWGGLARPTRVVTWP